MCGLERTESSFLIEAANTAIRRKRNPAAYIKPCENCGSYQFGIVAADGRLVNCYQRHRESLGL